MKRYFLSKCPGRVLYCLTCSGNTLHAPDPDSVRPVPAHEMLDASEPLPVLFHAFLKCTGCGGTVPILLDKSSLAVRVKAV